jgi:23S rRNA maturation-related 3'-5' exoribonuclease YhaM
MVNIEHIEDGVILHCMGSTIGLTHQEYQTLSNNLIVDYNEKKWLVDKWIEIPHTQKIKVEDLTYSMFNCLYNKHDANFNDSQEKKLNIRYLLDLCDWISM